MELKWSVEVIGEFQIILLGFDNLNFEWKGVELKVKRKVGGPSINRLPSPICPGSGSEVLKM